MAPIRERRLHDRGSTIVGLEQMGAKKFF